jgi:multiple sugar transport system permease protein
MITTTKPAPRLSATARSARGSRRPLRTWVIAVAAYVIAAIFLLPYLEMLVMALRPNSELGLATILP